MRFTVVSYGSEGDTRPIAALCRGLIDAGHEAQLFCDEASIRVAHAHDVPAEALTGSLQSTLPMDDPGSELSTRDVLRATGRGVRLVREQTERWMRVVADHARTADAVMFSGLTMLLGPAVARGVNKPGVSLMLQPLASPTRAFPAALLPPLALPGWVNRLTYRLPSLLLERLYGKATRAARATLFGTSVRAPLWHDGPVLYGFSACLVPRPADWPAHHQICGAWNFPAEHWSPPADLKAFLAAGPPPLYVGFGALSSFVRGRGLADIVAAVAGRRAVFYPGWSRIDESMLPDNFFVVGPTEHAWLFPRVGLAIHHGGAGTTHTAARAGIPSIVVPFGVDQFFWAGRLAELGVAPPHVRPGRLTAGALAHLIDVAGRADVRERARQLSRRMAGEDGVEFAVRAIEGLCGRFDRGR